MLVTIARHSSLYLAYNANELSKSAQENASTSEYIKKLSNEYYEKIEDLNQVITDFEI